MGVIMIRCPETRRAISTGIEADRETFRSTPVFISRTLCPFCRVTHEWFAGDAWVSEQELADCEPDRDREVARA